VRPGLTIKQRFRRHGIHEEQRRALVLVLGDQRNDQIIHVNESRATLLGF
jgi:hypothetical protein